jgi:hypothetical protein
MRIRIPCRPQEYKVCVYKAVYLESEFSLGIDGTYENSDIVTSTQLVQHDEARANLYSSVMKDLQRILEA